MQKGCLHIFIFTIMLAFSCEPAVSTSRALLIGISQYTVYPNTQWHDINGANDIRLLKTILQKDNFTIDTLLNSEATASNIRRALDGLIKMTKEHDTIYIHFSGHGQPFEDLNGDEEDGWDESFVPIDAWMWYKQGTYEGDKHILDDELNIIFDRFRKRIGEKGLLFVTIDACHSGTMYRDKNEIPLEDEAPVRGTYVGFSKDKTYHPSREGRPSHHYMIQAGKGESSIIVVEACQAWQQNTEILIDGQYYGPLSYAIYNELQNKSFHQIVQNIDVVDETMQQILPEWRKQHVVVETNMK